jgi:hypothetical protein
VTTRSPLLASLALVAACSNTATSLLPDASTADVPRDVVPDDVPGDVTTPDDTGCGAERATDETVYPRALYLTPGARTTVTVRTARDRCVPANFAVRVMDPQVATAGASNVTVGFRSSTSDLEITAVRAGATTVQIGNATLAVTVTASEIPTCPMNTPAVTGRLAAGAMVRGVMYASASSERGDVVFELRPPIEVATTFYLYYLPFDDRPCQTGPSSQCTTHYYKGRNKRRRLFASAAGRGRRAAAGGGGGGFRARVAAVLERPDWQGSLPRASVIGLEARTSKDAFHPMEVAVTSAETASLVAHASRQLRRLLVWPESREHPIRMLDRLPLRWLAAGVPAPNATVHAGTALRGEFYAFQLGVYAPVAALRLLPSWSAPVQVSVVNCLLMASDGL